MEANTQAILLMAWARSLGLPDDALTDPDELVLDTTAEDDAISVLRLLDRTVVSGPEWACEKAADFSPDALSTPAGLLALAKHRVPRVIRDDVLHYADGYPQIPGDPDAALTDDPAAYDELRGACAPDDLSHAGLDAVEHRVVLLDPDERPVAAAGWRDWQGIVADLAFVAAVDIRDPLEHLPLAQFVIGEVLDAGLIPQLRVERDNTVDAALAAQLGMVASGSHLVVALG